VQRAEDGSWHVIEVATGKELSKLESPGNLTTAIVTSDGQRVIGAGDKGEPARIWDAQTGRLLMGLSDVCVRAIGRSAVPRRIIVRDCDRNVRIWDAADWNLTREEYQAQRRAALAGRNP
jgi:WD40 repeat protein